MAFKFVIGLAPDDPQAEVIPCEGDPNEIHRDWWDNDDGPIRQPSLGDWWEILQAAPCLRSVYEDVERYAKEVGADWVPCQFYEDQLDQLEDEAGGLDQWPAARELWFVRWSRQALCLYGERAAFGASGDWR
jgi:hypothetical protein